MLSKHRSCFGVYAVSNKGRQATTSHLYTNFSDFVKLYTKAP